MLSLGRIGKTLSLIFIVAASYAGGLLLTKLENGTLTLWPGDLVEDTMAQLATVDPMTHAVLSDHMEETRAILETARDTKDWDAGRKKLLVMAATYSGPALSNTDDARAIIAAERSVDLFQALSIYHPTGCVHFLDGSFSIPDFSIPQVGEAYRIYSEALRVAYIEGKFNKSGKKLPVEQIGLIATETLGLTENDARAFQNPSDAQPQQLCEALKKFYNTKGVPPLQKGAYARTLISGGL